MSLNEAAKILGATHHGPNANYSSVCHDSRFVKPGSLYVALRGDRLDGHEFIADAKSKGAVGVLADHLVGYDLPSLVVPDTLLGLQLLASEWRSRFHCPLVGITGSNGKTTVKEMI
ncbi:MAG: UDP-N-acetylmuramoyl-tripeptide--D-alanyl-D-alanine ligase, partial [Parasphingorhabdus sp.]